PSTASRRAHCSAIAIRPPRRNSRARMKSPPRIRQFHVAPLDIPLHTPFGISGGAQAMANNVLATLELDDGTRGHGEAAPLPPYNGETQADALGILGAARPWLAGREIAGWQALAAEFR